MFLLLLINFNLWDQKRLHHKQSMCLICVYTCVISHCFISKGLTLSALCKMSQKCLLLREVQNFFQGGKRGAPDLNKSLGGVNLTSCETPKREKHNFSFFFWGGGLKTISSPPLSVQPSTWFAHVRVEMKLRKSFI